MLLFVVAGIHGCPDVFIDVPKGCIPAVNACAVAERQAAIVAALPNTRSVCPWNRQRMPNMTWCDLVRIECADGSFPFSDVPVGVYVSAVFIMISLLLVLKVKRAYTM